MIENMPACLIVCLPEGPTQSHWLDDAKPCSIGRSRDCDIVLDHPSVSRLHARLGADARGVWSIADAGSKNGSFVDGAAVTTQTLAAPHWLRFGDIHCEFIPAAADDVAADEQRRTQRRVQTQTLGDQLTRAPDDPDLLQHTVEAAAALTECDRAWLLFPEGDALRIGAVFGALPDAAARHRFDGSRTVIRRALAEARPIVINDTRFDAQLAKRASVITGGIRSTLALPLLHDGQPLAVLYADRHRSAEPISAFDMELLQAFAERAVLWIAARRRLLHLQALPRFEDPAAEP